MTTEPEEPVVEVACVYHAPLMIEYIGGGRPWCGCGGISVGAAAAEINRLRARMRELTRET